MLRDNARHVIDLTKEDGDYSMYARFAFHIKSCTRQ